METTLLIIVRCCSNVELEQAGLKITSSGSISAEEIDQGQLIDNHYYAIASKATLLTPDKLNVRHLRVLEHLSRAH